MPANTLPRLHDAAAEGDLDAVKALIGAGAAINEQDELGRTAAHYAIYSSRDVLLELLASGANIGLKDFHVLLDLNSIDWNPSFRKVLAREAKRAQTAERQRLQRASMQARQQRLNRSREHVST